MRSVLFAMSVGLFALLSAAQAATMDELKERFKQRYPKLVKAKSDGKVGEVYTGYIEAVKAEYMSDAEIKKLVEDENADRVALYELIAKKEKITPEKVAERNAARNFQNAKPGEWLKGQDGKWAQKR